MTAFSHINLETYNLKDCHKGFAHPALWVPEIVMTKNTKKHTKWLKRKINVLLGHRGREI